MILTTDQANYSILAYQETSSTVANRTKEAISLGEACILGGPNSLAVSWNSGNTVSLSSGRCIIDNMFIKNISDMNLDLSDISYSMDHASNPLIDNGYHYLVLYYKHTIAYPQNLAQIYLMTPNEIISNYDPKYYLILKVIETSGSSIINVYDKDPSSSSDPKEGRFYNKIFAEYYTELPTFNPNKDKGKIIIVDDTDNNIANFYVGISDQWYSMKGDFSVRTSIPTATDDSYDIGYIWIYSGTGQIYVCFDNTPSNAIWRPLTTSIISTRAPLTTDNTYSLLTLWLNTTTNDVYFCSNVTGSVATWTKATVKTLSDLSSPTASFDFDGHVIENLGDPVNEHDSVYKSWVLQKIAENNTWLKSVIAYNINTPPNAPLDGDRYFIGTSPIGVWAGHPLEITEYNSSTASWSFTKPEQYSVMYVTKIKNFIVFTNEARDPVHFFEEFLQLNRIGAPTEALNMHGHKIVSMADPTSGQDAMTRQYYKDHLETDVSDLSVFLKTANNLSDISGETNKALARGNLGIETPEIVSFPVSWVWNDNGVAKEPSAEDEAKLKFHTPTYVIKTKVFNKNNYFSSLPYYYLYSGGIEPISEAIDGNYYNKLGGNWHIFIKISNFPLVTQIISTSMTLISGFNDISPNAGLNYYDYTTQNLYLSLKNIDKNSISLRLIFNVLADDITP